MSIFFIFHKQLPDKFFWFRIFHENIVLFSNRFKYLPDTQLALFAAVSDFSRLLDPHKICINVMSLTTWTPLGKALNQFATSIFYVIKKLKPGTKPIKNWHICSMDQHQQKTKTPPKFFWKSLLFLLFSPQLWNCI